MTQLKSGLLIRASGLMKEDGTDSLLTQIGSVFCSYNAPFEVFNLITSFFNLSHAVVFAIDEEAKVYFPIAYKNLDRTTLSRLNIPENSIEKLADASLNLKKYLSYADSQLFSKYVTYPLDDKNEYFFTVLLNGTETRLEEMKSFLEEQKKTVYKKMTCFISQKKEKTNSGNRINPLFVIKSGQFIKNNKSRNFAFFLIYIDCRDTIKKMLLTKNKISHNPFRLEYKFQDLLETNFEEHGFLTRLNFGEYLLVCRLAFHLSPELLEIHLNNTFKHLFKAEKRWESISFNYRPIYQPENVETISREIIHTF